MKAMILCAGHGTRLGELTREIPKPMLDVVGRPLLEHIVTNLVRHGFDELVINLHFRPDVIPAHFGDGAKWNARITYSHEPQLLGTAGGVKNVARIFQVSAEPFLVHYGDIVTDQDFSALLRFHRERAALATLLTHRRAKSNSALELADDGRITRFLERPAEGAAHGIESPWVFSGVTIAEPALLDEIPAGTACDLPRDVYSRIAGAAKLFGFPLTGNRVAVDSPERLNEARRLAAAW